jgi:cobalt/nickel transport system permease protein
MHHDFLDRWSRLESPIHRAPAPAKIATAAALVLTCVAVPLGASWVFGVVAAALVVVAWTSRIPAAFILGRLLLLEPLVVGVAALALLQPHGARVVLSIVLRSTLCLATMILLTNTTPFAELLGTLRRLRLPALLITVLALMYRYLFVLIDEAERMQRARRSRTFSRLRSWPSLASLVGLLFVRSTERAERIYAAMCARGWR